MIVSLAAGFCVISRKALKLFAQSRRRPTSDARLSSLTSTLSRALRRRASRIMLRWRFSSHRRVTSDVFCSHNLSFRCYADIAAMSAQYGTSRVAAEAVRPMVDSVADFRTCSTDFHVSLAVVLALRGDYDTDTTSWNCSRKHLVANNSVLYRTCLDMRSFSIRPQTSKIRMRSSSATSCL